MGFAFQSCSQHLVSITMDVKKVFHPHFGSSENPSHYQQKSCHLTKLASCVKTYLF